MISELFEKPQKRTENFQFTIFDTTKLPQKNIMADKIFAPYTQFAGFEPDDTSYIPIAIVAGEKSICDDVCKLDRLPFGQNFKLDNSGYKKALLIVKSRGAVLGHNFYFCLLDTKKTSQNIMDRLIFVPIYTDTDILKTPATFLHLLDRYLGNLLVKIPEAVSNRKVCHQKAEDAKDSPIKKAERMQKFFDKSNYMDANELEKHIIKIAYDNTVIMLFRAYNPKYLEQVDNLKDKVKKEMALGKMQKLNLPDYIKYCKLKERQLKRDIASTKNKAPQI